MEMEMERDRRRAGSAYLPTTLATLEFLFLLVIYVFLGFFYQIRVIMLL